MGKECKYCYGKGYSTQLIGGYVASADFYGERNRLIKGPHIILHYCGRCAKGRKLRKEAEKHAEV